MTGEAFTYLVENVGASLTVSPNATSPMGENVGVSLTVSPNATAYSDEYVYSPPILTLAGSGGLTGTGVPGPSGTRALAGSGVLVGAGSSVGHAGAAALAGSGFLSSAGSGSTQAGESDLSGSGTLSGTGVTFRTGSAATSGTGTLEAVSYDYTGTLTTAGTGTLVATGTAHHPATWIPLFGMSSKDFNWDTDKANIENTGGQLQARRIFGSPITDTGARARAEEAVAQGLYPIVSFKPSPYSWSQVAAGNADSELTAIRNWAKTLTARVFITFNHEPGKTGHYTSVNDPARTDDGQSATSTPSDYVDMHYQAYQVMCQGTGAATNIDLGCILNGWMFTVDPNTGLRTGQGYSDAELDAWLIHGTKNLLTICKCIAADDYQIGPTASDPTPHLKRRIDYLKSKNFAGYTGTAEFGSYTSSITTKYYNAVTSAALAPYIGFVAYWSGSDNYRLTANDTNPYNGALTQFQAILAGWATNQEPDNRQGPTGYVLNTDGTGGSGGGGGTPIPPSPAVRAGNDDFADAATVTLSEGAFGASGVSFEATVESGEPVPTGYGRTLWWTWTPTATITTTIDLGDSYLADGSSAETRLTVYTGTSVDSLTEITSVPDSLTQSFTAGTTYHFQASIPTSSDDVTYAFSVVPDVTVEQYVMDLEVLGGVLTAAPTAVTVVIEGGLPEDDVVFKIDGTIVDDTTLSDDGTLEAFSVNVPDGYGQGTHLISVHSTTSDLAGDDTFTLTRGPYLSLQSVGADAPPVEIEEANTSTGVRRWVLQDLMPGGLGSYVLPYNPRTMSPPEYQRTLSQSHTTAVNDGQYHLASVARQAVQWEFAGYLDTQEFADQLQAYFALERRFYVMDHRARAWVVTFTRLEIVPRKRQHNPSAGTFNDWAHDYTVQALIYDQTPGVPQ